MRETRVSGKQPDGGGQTLYSHFTDLDPTRHYCLNRLLSRSPNCGFRRVAPVVASSLYSLFNSFPLRTRHLGSGFIPVVSTIDTHVMNRVHQGHCMSADGSPGVRCGESKFSGFFDRSKASTVFVPRREHRANMGAFSR